MQDQVYACVRSIPAGQVASYGEVARLSGFPGRARMVGWCLSRLSADTDVPWHRVVNRTGRISITYPLNAAEIQAERLQSEGVEIELCPDGWYARPSQWYKG